MLTVIIPPLCGIGGRTGQGQAGRLLPRAERRGPGPVSMISMAKKIIVTIVKIICSLLVIVVVAVGL
ncbi:MAG: hypothetical protein LBR19_08340, partial [Bifidobacteriaceae bacterium]|nr:hypothetical protein [Bifidobacteriaceae bacterium]